eukprot:g53493.t1
MRVCVKSILFRICYAALILLARLGVRLARQLIALECNPRQYNQEEGGRGGGGGGHGVGFFLCDSTLVDLALEAGGGGRRVGGGVHHVRLLPPAATSRKPQIGRGYRQRRLHQLRLHPILLSYPCRAKRFGNLHAPA